MKLVQVISSLIKDTILFTKVKKMGKDVGTGLNATPFGIDSNIPAGYRAIYADTENESLKVIIGYVNIKALTKPGELRLFSEKSDKSLGFQIYLKNDGTCEMNGNADFLVRFSALETAFKGLQTSFNAFATNYVPGGPSTQGLPANITPDVSDISGAKITNLKTSING